MKTFPKKPLVITALLGVSGDYRIESWLTAQETATSSTTSIIPKSPANLRSIESYSETQLTQLINTLPLHRVDLAEQFSANGNMSGTFGSLAHPDWPPLPCTFGTPFWNFNSTFHFIFSNVFIVGFGFGSGFLFAR